MRSRKEIALIGGKFPTLQELYEIARHYFPSCQLSDLQLGLNDYSELLIMASKSSQRMPSLAKTSRKGVVRP